ncbi:endopeptidase La [Mycoplasma zalophidermidis]|uniref:endopeptidase La n=1 Tax=Mycoplasma zalophidermidis TaxID=398174 RepID=UPI001C111D4C|nr:endopeptidase La [Mycoplasma zalophidermidis]MBU4689755.1 endopeptidase La [Mycoplasma zalophidermidis]
MTEKLLVAMIGDEELNTGVIYGHETKIIEVKPYGQFWTEKYLDSLTKKWTVSNAIDFIEDDSIIVDELDSYEQSYDTFEPVDSKQEYLMLAYHFVGKNDSNYSKKNIADLTVNNLEHTMTYCRIKHVKKEKSTYQITLVGIGRHTIESFNFQDASSNKLIDVISVNTNKYPYRTTSTDFTAETSLLTQIEEATTQLAQSEVWQRIAYNMFAIHPYSSRNSFDNESQKYLPPITADSTIVDLILSILFFTIADNLTKYNVLNADKTMDQLQILKEYILSFRDMENWSPKELATFDSIGLFNESDSKTNSKRKTKKTKSGAKGDAVSDALVENEINKKVKDNLEKQQREFLLKEKLRAIKESLQENDSDPEEEESEYSKIMKDNIKKQMFPESVTKLIKTETNKLKGMMSGTPDANISASYINILKSMPWRKVEIETLDIKKAREILDKNHYGLGEVKERIIEYLSLIINHKNEAQKSKGKLLLDFDENHQIDMELFKEDEQITKVQKNFNNVPILTLVGPPGTGKTSLARAIAEALNKSYVKISLGGVHDESEIRGHRRTYVGSMPGKIIKAIQKSGVSNPLILLDEIDKMSSDYKGDPSSAMLEVLDPEQNTKFQDNYLEHEYDLSKVMFIATANYYDNIPAPLLDRVEIIELNSYTINEKVKIAREHLLDICTRQAGLKPEQFQIEDSVIEAIIKHYTAEAGVRALKRQFDKIARKIVTKIVSGENIKTFVIDLQTAFYLLGTPKFSELDKIGQPQVGVVNGLAYTSIGGSTLQIEVSQYENKNGGFKLTGSLKDVMKESASIAYSFVRSNAKKYDINFDFESNEVHIHVPEGAVPKDGPSAGVTFTTALISALSNKPVPQDVAMTGEITLRGRVLEIGGLKEKSFAAFKKGIKTVFIPKSNQKNLIDIPEEVKKAIKFVPVENYDEIYSVLFK